MTDYQKYGPYPPLSDPYGASYQQQALREYERQKHEAWMHGGYYQQSYTDPLRGMWIDPVNLVPASDNNKRKQQLLLCTSNPLGN